MSAGQPTDIVLSYGMISFDGRGLELFADEDEGKRGDLESLVEMIRRSSPKLGEAL